MLSVAGLEDHGPAGLLHREVDKVGAADDVAAVLGQVVAPVLQGGAVHGPAGGGRGG